MFKKIIVPLLYFDIFDYPLTAVEVWQWQWQGDCLGLPGIRMGLDGMVKQGQVEFKEGFYFMPGKSANVIKRLDRYNLAEEKYKKAKKVVWFLARLPFIRMIAVCNTLAYSNAQDNSDIDLFIITAKNRIWIARYFCVIFLKMFGLQPDPKNMKNKFCLSFFVSEDNLDLKSCLLTEKDGWPDIYFLYWFITLYPIYDQGGYFNKLWQANSWIKDFFPEAKPAQANPRRTNKVDWFFRGVKKIKEIQSQLFGNAFFRSVQMKIMAKQLKEMANRDTRVIINDKMLKFHDNDRRAEFKQDFLARTKNEN